MKPRWPATASRPALRVFCVVAIWGAWVLAASLGAAQAEAQNSTTAGRSAAAQVHEVRAGESLWSIAEIRLGHARLWPLIYRANRDQIMDPTRLFVGQRLNIPQLSEEEKKAALSDASLPQELKPVLATPEPAPSEATPAAAAADSATDSSVGAPPLPASSESSPTLESATVPSAPSAADQEASRETAPPSEPAHTPSATPSANGTAAP